MDKSVNPFQELSKDDIFNKELIREIISLDAEADVTDLKQKEISYLKDRARELKCYTEFNKMLQKYLKENQNVQNNTIDFVYNKILAENKIKVFNKSIYVYENGRYNNNEILIDRIIYNIEPNATVKFMFNVKEKIKTMIDEEASRNKYKSNCI